MISSSAFFLEWGSTSMNTNASWLRQIVVACGLLVILTAIVGVAYPAVVWGVSRIDRTSAEGSPIADHNGCVIGSDLIGVDPQVPPGESDRYLHTRVSGSADNPMAPGDPEASGAGNQGPSSEELARMIDTRRRVIADREGVRPDQVPVDAITGSGSGLDPDISETYAALQIPRLARENGLSAEHVRTVIERHTDGRQLGFLGEPGVNVVQVNLDLGFVAPVCG